MQVAWVEVWKGGKEAPTGKQETYRFLGNNLPQWEKCQQRQQGTN